MASLAVLAGKEVSRLSKRDIEVLRRINARRSPRALRMDLSRNARVPLHVGPWLRRPGHYDIPGVDTAVTDRKALEHQLLNNPEVQRIKKIVERLFHTRMRVKEYSGVPVLVSEDNLIGIALLPANRIIKRGYIVKKIRGAPITRNGITYIRIKGKTLKYPKNTGELILRLRPTSMRVQYYKKFKRGLLELVIGKRKKVYVFVAPKPKR